MAAVSVSFAGHALALLPCGAAYWPAEQLLLVADLHLEKGSHFARRGFLLPPHDTVETLARIAAALEATGARRLVALGDSFHDPGGLARMSAPARGRLDALLARVSWTWIAGNHDGVAAAGLGGTSAETLEVAGVLLRHEADPRESLPEISGHFHPRVALPLRTGRRAVRRCFALGNRRLVLPAYGAFAGGLDIGDPAFALLGPGREALVPTTSGLVRLPVATPACHAA
ncbi:MAG: ligase-associated DNA damage response endonuclease PdeM [Thermaurantiacus sp.]